MDRVHTRAAIVRVLREVL